MQFQFNIYDYAKNFCVNKSKQFDSKSSGSHLSIFRTLCSLDEQFLPREVSVSDFENLQELRFHIYWLALPKLPDKLKWMQQEWDPLFLHHRMQRSALQGQLSRSSP